MQMDLIQYFYSHPLTINKIDSSDIDLISLNGSIKSSSGLSAQSSPVSTVAPTVDLKSENIEVESPISSKRTTPELSLNEKIDAIMESTKRKNKQIKHEMKYKRNRKSKEQVIILHEELSKGLEMTNEKLNEISMKTGLSKVQVYKWYWDYKNKKIKAE